MNSDGDTPERDVLLKSGERLAKRCYDAGWKSGYDEGYRTGRIEAIERTKAHMKHLETEKAQAEKRAGEKLAFLELGLGRMVEAGERIWLQVMTPHGERQFDLTPFEFLEYLGCPDVVIADRCDMSLRDVSDWRLKWLAEHRVMNRSLEQT